MSKPYLYRHALSRCPGCNHPIDTSRDTSESVRFPVPGDFSVCGNCAGLLVFNEDLTLRAGTRKDLDELDSATAYSIGQATGQVLKRIKARRRP